MNMEEKNKEYPIKLKNGNIIYLSEQDLISNNINKLEDEIPDLKIENTISDNNPLKKVIKTIESGLQIKKTYYLGVSLILLCYIWGIQIFAYFNNLKIKNLLLFVSLWGTYSILRLHIKPHFQVNTLQNLLFKKDLSFFTSSISYSLIGLSVAYSIIVKEEICQTVSWKNIGERLLLINLHEITYIEFLFIAGLCVALLIGLYNIFAYYERFRMISLLNIDSVGIRILSCFLFITIILFLPFVMNEVLCGMKGIILVFSLISILPYSLLGILFSKTFVLAFLLLRHMALKINK